MLARARAAAVVDLEGEVVVVSSDLDLAEEFGGFVSLVSAGVEEVRELDVPGLAKPTRFEDLEWICAILLEAEGREAELVARAQSAAVAALIARVALSRTHLAARRGS
jgi:hypothetical protein